MRLSDFDFDLPEALIALRPAEPRSSARLLVQDGATRHHATMIDLPEYLKPGDHLVFNDTKVIPARLDGVRVRGEIEARVELTLVAETGRGTWRALARPARKMVPGDALRFGALRAEVVAREGPEAEVRFDAEGPAFWEALDREGAMPLPPYIAAKRAPDARDREAYQSLLAERPGAIAAPTASLHFDDALFAALRAKGIGWTTVTLHVGPGTFLPVQVENVADHRMHAEWGEVTEEAALAINQAGEAGRIIPVGTTALRLLESATGPDGKLRAFRGETDIFITPGYRFRITEGLITNFHLPKSTLMMLVSALMGRDRMGEIYADAIEREYRFFSYGDGSLLLPDR